MRACPGQRHVDERKLEEILQEIRALRDDAVLLGQRGLTEGAPQARILLVTQAPSRRAAEEGVLFDRRNPSSKVFQEVFGLPDDEWGPQTVFWTHFYNLYPGRGKGGDKVPPSTHARRFLYPLLRALDPCLVVLTGWINTRFFFRLRCAEAIDNQRGRPDQLFWVHDPQSTRRWAATAIRNPSPAAANFDRDLEEWSRTRLYELMNMLRTDCCPTHGVSTRHIS